MTTIRIHHQKNYTVIQNSAIRNTNLSWKARGILVFLLSHPDNWEINIIYLIKQAPDGRAAVRAALDELEKYGYLEKIRSRTKKGAFLTKYLLYEVPLLTEANNSNTSSKCENRNWTKNNPPQTTQNRTQKPQKSAYCECGEKSENVYQEPTSSTSENRTRSSGSPSAKIERGTECENRTRCIYKDLINTEIEINTPPYNPPKGVSEEGENNSPSKNFFQEQDSHSGYVKTTNEELRENTKNLEQDNFSEGCPNIHQLTRTEQQQFWKQLKNYKLKSDKKLSEGKAESIASATLKRLLNGLEQPQDYIYLSEYLEGKYELFSDNRTNHQNIEMAKLFAKGLEALKEL